MVEIILLEEEEEDLEEDSIMVRIQETTHRLSGVL